MSIVLMLVLQDYARLDGQGQQQAAAAAAAAAAPAPATALVRVGSLSATNVAIDGDASPPKV
jgi:hypothetical protein